MTNTTETLEAILESANDAIITLDGRGCGAAVEPSRGAALRPHANEMLGQHLDAIIPERFREAHRAGIERVGGGGETHVIGSTAELAGLHSDGREFPIELSLAQWENNGKHFFTGIIRDITDRMRLMGALSESQARMGAILDSANDAIITIDNRGYVLLWNPHAEQLFGYTANEMLGQHLDTIIPERFREAHRAGIERVGGGGETHVIGTTVELAAVHRDGHEVPVELSLALWESDGDRYFSGIIRDVTQRRQAGRGSTSRQ